MAAIATGSADRSARADTDRHDEIAAVGRAVNTVLNALAEQDARVAVATLERVEPFTASFEQQRDVESVRAAAHTIEPAAASAASPGASGPVHVCVDGHERTCELTDVSRSTRGSTGLRCVDPDGGSRPPARRRASR
jgi:hypothetical protein